MTLAEFKTIKTGTILSCRSEKDEQYVVYMEDSFGEGYRGKEFVTYELKSVNTEPCKYARLSKSNMQFWTIEG